MWYAIDFANDPKSPPIKRFKSSAGNTYSTNTRNTGHTIIDYNVCVPLEGRTNTVKCVSPSLSLSLSVYVLFHKIKMYRFVLSIFNFTETFLRTLIDTYEKRYSGFVDQRKRNPHKNI